MSKKKLNDYLVRLQVSFIISLLFFIILFFLCPKWNSTITLHSYPTPIIIKWTTIPRTEQLKHKSGPPPIRPEIPIPDDEFEMADYAEILIESTSIDSSLKAPGNINMDVHPVLLLPRQIFEILPSIDGNCQGRITLLLKIGADGKVVSYKVIKNDTGDELCLEATLKAIEGSQWESAIIDGEAVEYWINKTYQFEK